VPHELVSVFFIFNLPGHLPHSGLRGDKFFSQKVRLAVALHGVVGAVIVVLSALEVVVVFAPRALLLVSPLSLLLLPLSLARAWAWVCAASKRRLSRAA
jgi:hypothetical protein